MVYSYPRARTYVRRKTQCSKDKIKKQGEEKRVSRHDQKKKTKENTAGPARENQTRRRNDQNKVNDRRTP
jgi:hypothetical protein